MSALLKIRNAGFDVVLDGDSFKVTPASLLTTKLREFLKSHKAEIMAELSTVIVVCYSPSDLAYEVKATSPEYGDFLRRMNPPPAKKGRCSK